MPWATPIGIGRPVSSMKSTVSAHVLDQRNAVRAHVAVGVDRDVRVVAAHAAVERGSNGRRQQERAEKDRDAGAPAAETRRRPRPTGRFPFGTRLGGAASDAGHHRA